MDTEYYIAPPALENQVIYTIKILALHNSTRIHLHFNTPEEVYIANVAETITRMLNLMEYCAAQGNYSCLGWPSR